MKKVKKIAITTDYAASRQGRRRQRRAMCLAGAAGGLVGLTFISLLSLAYPREMTATAAFFLSAGFTTIGLLLGAHIDLNRYFLVKWRDHKALCFKSPAILLFSVSKNRHQPPAPQASKQPAEAHKEIPDSAITTVVYENIDHHPHADTFRRDKVLASARQALLSMDHTKQIRH